MGGFGYISWFGHLENFLMNGKLTYEELVQSIKGLDKELSDKDHLINALEEKLTKFEMTSSNPPFRSIREETA